MKRSIIAVILSLVMIFGLVACGAKTEEKDTNTNEVTTGAETKATEAPSTESQEPITLRMAWWGSQARHDITTEVINMYMKENPNVKIEFEFYSYDDYFTKLKTLVASDQVWDIFQLGGNFPMYIDKIEFLNDYIASGVVDTSNIPEAYLQITQDTQGNQIGLSNGLNTYGIAYDVDMFNEAGVALPSSNWTWDDYADAAMKIMEHTGHYGSSGFTTSDFIAGCSTYIGQQGKVGEYGFFNIDLTGMGFNDPSMLEGYIKMRSDLIKAGASPDAGAEMEITNIENDFLVTGEAAMTWVAVNQFPTIYDICEKEGRTLNLAPLPRVTNDGPSGAVIQSSQMLCVSKDSANKDAAAAFISYFQNSVECNNVLRGERGIPVNTTVREALKQDLTPGQQIMYDYVDLVGSFETPEKVNVLSPDGQDQVVDQYRNFIQQVVSGEITVEEAAEKTYAAAEAIFKK